MELKALKPTKSEVKEAMEFALSSQFCLDKGLQGLIRELERLSTCNIEICDSGPHTLNRNSVDLLKEHAASFGTRFSVHAPYADTNLAADDPYIREAILERLERSLVMASELEAEAWIFHGGWYTAVDKNLPGRAWDKNKASIEILAAFSKEVGVKQYLENCPDHPMPFILRSVHDFERLYGEGIEVDMVLDLGHANVMGDTADYFRIFPDEIGYIHASDNLGESDSHLPLGNGSIDWGHWLRELEAIGFNGWFVVESLGDPKLSLDYIQGINP